MSVKCSPAVGAETAPGLQANEVWWQSRSANSSTCTAATARSRRFPATVQVTLPSEAGKNYRTGLRQQLQHRLENQSAILCRGTAGAQLDPPRPGSSRISALLLYSALRGGRRTYTTDERQRRCQSEPRRHSLAAKGPTTTWVSLVVSIVL